MGPIRRYTTDDRVAGEESSVNAIGEYRLVVAVGRAAMPITGRIEVDIAEVFSAGCWQYAPTIAEDEVLWIEEVVSEGGNKRSWRSC